MLKIYDKNHKQLGMLTKYDEPKVEAILSSADKTLTFTIKDPDELPIQNEYYVRTRTDEFVVKKTSHKSWSDLQVTCLLNLEELQGNPFLSFSVKEVGLREAAELALDGTGWSVGECDVEKIRSAGMVNCNSIEVIDNLCAVWMCDHSYDTIHKKVNFYKKMGARRGAYFMEGLNLKRITKESDSYDYYTRIIPIGANGLTIESVNGGRNYLENYSYSNKILTYIWKDESYTDPQALLEDAEAKLDELAHPVVTYACDIIDLAKQRKEFGILSYSLGDEVKLINRETRTLDTQRITKTVEYLHNPEKNSCEFANAATTFTEMQEKIQKATEIINFLVTGDGRYSGTINVSDILNLESGISGSSVVKAFEQDVGTLKKDVKTITVDSEALKKDMEIISGNFETWKKDITELKEKIGLIIDALSNVISDEPPTDTEETQNDSGTTQSGTDVTQTEET